jgi:hypothetical protein
MPMGDAWRYVGRSTWILALLALPFAGYALHTYGQLKDIEARQLRNLAGAAEAIQQLVENSEATVGNLLRRPQYACEFFGRQKRLELVDPGDCADFPARVPREASMRLEHSGGELIVSDGTGLEPRAIIRLRFDKVLAEIPAGGDLEILLLADNRGRVVAQLDDIPGPAHLPRRDPGSRAPLRIVGLSDLVLPKGGELKASELRRYTTVQSVVLAGAGYRLMCQPIASMANGAAGSAAAGADGHWVLCGLVAQGQQLREALLVAPQFTMALIALLLLALLVWPILKFMAVAPRERVRFGDVYLMLLGTWGALMVITLLVVSLDTYAALRKSQGEGLKGLAQQVEANLLEDMRDWREQLSDFDTDLQGLVAERVAGADPRDSRLKGPERDVKRMLLVPNPVAWARFRPQDDPRYYRFFGQAFWMRPCDGMQLVKLTIRSQNTPPVSVAEREYFQAVQRGTLWDIGGRDGVFLQSFRSITTGEFQAALAMPSGLSMDDLYPADEKATLWNSMLAKNPDCSSADIAVAAISGRPVSMHRPVLPPGVGFAVIDLDGTVVFHSEERRAVFENFFQELDDPAPLGAALRAQSSQALELSYGARPHQLHVHPVSGLPWAVVTFADDVLLRTVYIEMLMSGGVFVFVHLGLYFLLTVLYLLIRGRATPRWLWPYLSTRPETYAWVTWLMGMAVVASMLVLGLLAGAWLLWAGLLVPLVAIMALAIGPRVLADEAHSARRVRALSLGGGAFVLLLAAMVWLGVPRGGTPGIGAHAGLAALLLLFAAGAVRAPERLAQHVVARRLPRHAPAPLRLTRQLDVGRWGHEATAFLIWIIIGILPAWGYARYAVAEQLEVLVRHENLHVASGLAARAAAITEHYRAVDGGAEVLPRRLALEQRDVYWSGMYYAPAEGRQRASDRAEPCVPAAAPKGLWPRKDDLPGLPIFNDTARELRNLMREGPGAGSWHRSETRDVMGRPELVFCTTIYQPGGDPLELRSHLPLPGAQLRWLSLAGVIVTGLLLVAWVRFGTRRLFFGEVSVGWNEPHYARAFYFNPGDIAPATVSGISRGLARRVDARWLERELAACPGARESVAASSAQLPMAPTRKEALEWLVAQLAPLYQDLWDHCTPDEQLVLAQLSREGVVNPKQVAAVRSLLQRGLLVRNPVLQVMNQGFALFAVRAWAPREMSQLERGEGTSPWRRMRWLLILAVVGIVGFLWLTQPTVVDSVVAFLGVATTGALALMKLTEVFTRTSGGRG